MPLTATKLPDGMYLVRDNPFSDQPSLEPGHQFKPVMPHDYLDFMKAHPPILALFKCTEGQRFEDGEVELVEQYFAFDEWHTGKFAHRQITRQVYTLKSDKGGEKVELKAELDYGVKVDFGHYENGRPYLTIYDEKDTFLFGNDCIVKLRDFLNQLPLNPPQP